MYTIDATLPVLHQVDKSVYAYRRIKIQGEEEKILFRRIILTKRFNKVSKSI